MLLNEINLPSCLNNSFFFVKDACLKSVNWVQGHPVVLISACNLALHSLAKLISTYITTFMFNHFPHLKSEAWSNGAYWAVVVLGNSGLVFGLGVSLSTTVLTAGAIAGTLWALQVVREKFTAAKLSQEFDANF